MTSTRRRTAVGLLAVLLALASPAVQATDADDEDLATKLQNPIADLISVPVQSNWDFGVGPADAMRYRANIQPVVPFSLGHDWNLITRTIVPVIHAESPADGIGEASGLGDILQSFFLSPKASVGGWIVGAGPAVLYPSATDSLLGGEKWAAGPTAVVLRQQSGWTVGMLANHLWSFAGTSSRQDVSATFMQPFLAYTTATATTLTLQTETTYDWKNEQGTVPLHLLLSQLVRIGRLPMQFQVGPRWYAERPSGGPDWGLRFTVTLLLPK